MRISIKGHGMRSVREEIDRRLARLQVGGCTCMTKTPELKYHDERCTYRLASEIAILLDQIMEVTQQEKELILRKRKEAKENQERWDKQKACKHKNKIHEGRFGHNGDDWYRCPDCGYTWDE